MKISRLHSGMVLKHGIFIGKYCLQRVGFRITEGGTQTKINIEQAVAVNYIVAVTLTMLVLKPDLSNPQVFFTDVVALRPWAFAANRICHYG